MQDLFLGTLVVYALIAMPFVWHANQAVHDAIKDGRATPWGRYSPITKHVELQRLASAGDGIARWGIRIFRVGYALFVFGFAILALSILSQRLAL